MRHNVAHRKLGRVTEHRLALLRNQAIALLRHEKIETTMPSEGRYYNGRKITLSTRPLSPLVPLDEDFEVDAAAQPSMA